MRSAHPAVAKSPSLFRMPSIVQTRLGSRAQGECRSICHRKVPGCKHHTSKPEKGLPFPDTPRILLVEAASGVVDTKACNLLVAPRCPLCHVTCRGRTNPKEIFGKKLIDC